MKFYEMIKCDNYEPILLDRDVHTDNTNQNVIINDPPKGFDSTILNDDEINEVLSDLLEFQSKYFGCVPLASDLEKKFVWNIPKKVYDAAQKAKNYSMPDCMNPLYWFYLFCTEEPVEMIGKFIITAVNSIEDSEYDILESSADEYDESLKEESEEE